MSRRPDPKIAELRLQMAAQARHIAMLEATLAERTSLVSLKAAARTADLPYEQARRLCVRGLVNSKRVGGRIFACPGDLLIHARRKM
jgi:hypothetical protein